MNNMELKRYRLHPAVFYRKYNEQVVVYNTKNQMVYTFNESAGDILDCFRNLISLEDIKNKIISIYEIDDIRQLSEYVEHFSLELLKKEIIIAEYLQVDVLESLEKDIYSQFNEGEQLCSVTMELTYRCNEKCRHCYIVDEEKREMPYNKVIGILDELAELNAFGIVFTGGEPFVRRDSLEIFEYAYSKGFLIEIFTNGTLLTSDDIIRLKSIWPKWIHFSLYSHIAEKHDAVTRVKGSFNKTLKAIQSCITVGIPVNIKVPVFEETKDDVEEVMKLANTLGCSVEPGQTITPKKNGNLSPLKMKILDEEDEYLVADRIERLVQTTNEHPNEEQIREKICGAGARSISIDPYGNVFPCNMFQLNIGNVFKNSIHDIWEKSEKLKWWRLNNQRSLLSGCEGCKMLNECVFCPGEAMIRTGSPLTKYDAACHITERAVRRKMERR